MSRLRVVLVALALLAGLILPSGASAHAVLEGSDPANDLVLKQAPTSITLRFSERVEPVGSIQIFNDQAAQITVGDQTRVADTVTRTPIKGTLVPGTYTVVWRVLSSDGHAVNGAFVFHVKKRGPNPQGIIGQIGTGTPSKLLRTTASMARWFNLAFLVLVIGGVVAMTTFLAGRLPTADRRLWYTLSAFGFCLSISSAITVILQGAEVRGITVGGAAQGGVIGEVLTTQFGQVRLAQLLLAEVIAIVAVWGASAQRSGRTVATLWTAGGLLALTPALSGHAVSVGIVGIILDAVHMVAASTWVGGLAFILIGLALEEERRTGVARDVLPHFSRVALIAVGVVVATGVVNGLIELGGPANLWRTDYGWHLVIKIALVALLFMLGARNRRAVAATATDAGGDGGERLHRRMKVEMGVMVAVLGVTTLLIAEPPARSVGSGQGSQTATARAGDTTIRVVVDPARQGPNLVHVYLGRDGRSVDPQEVRVAATNRGAKLGPISAPTERNEPGHYVAQSMPLTATGDWQFVVRLRTGEFDSTEATVTVRVRSAAAR